jgi:hypothetical protein
MENEEFEKFINQDFNSFSEWLFSLNAYEFALIASIIGFIIAPTLTINQQNSLGNFFELLGQVLLTISSQNATLKQKSVQNSKIRSTMETDRLEKEILLIKREIIQLRRDVLLNNKQ